MKERSDLEDTRPAIKRFRERLRNDRSLRRKAKQVERLLKVEI
jgi:hypothetical protein